MSARTNFIKARQALLLEINACAASLPHDADEYEKHLIDELVGEYNDLLPTDTLLEIIRLNLELSKIKFEADKLAELIVSMRD